MRKLLALETMAALEEGAPRNVSSSNDFPTIVPGHRFASNDATCEDPTISVDDAEQAIAAIGFIDHATADPASSARPSSYELYRAARANRSFVLGESIVAAVRSIGAIARRAHARHRQRRQARDVGDALRQLDDRMLRDLGFDRSEIMSVAAEMTGEAEPTRVRPFMTSHTLPW